jgi:hypothetical protein
MIKLFDSMKLVYVTVSRSKFKEVSDLLSSNKIEYEYSVVYGRLEGNGPVVFHFYVDKNYLEIASILLLNIEKIK